MSYYRKIVAGLVKDDIINFVGEVGNIFFNIDTGELRLSDGITPGGLPIYNSQANGMKITGSVQTAADLPDPYYGIIGDTFITADAGDFYIWDGSIWINTGPILGPRGYRGQEGYTGSASTEKGYTGSSGAYAGMGYTGSAGRNGTGYFGLVSLTAVTVGTGQKTFIVNEPYGNTAFTVGARIRVSFPPNPDNFMEGILLSYSGTTLVLNSTTTQGFGTYSSWDFNIAGEAGSDGIIGRDGYTGSQGSDGAYAGMGYTGSRGTDGSVGSVGYTGSKGEQGLPGAYAAVGYTGSASTVAGYSGSRGTDGIIGYWGSVGYAGSKGTDGTAGSVGYTGSRGLDGAAVDKGYTGSHGADGYWGSVGTAGYWGSVGYSGSKGDTGPQGVSISLKGAVNTVGNLPATGNSQNDAYIVYADEDLYVWNGTSWNNVGQIIGFTGSQGNIGYSGSKGDTGYVGSASTVVGYSGSVGFTGSQGIAGAYAGMGYTGSRGVEGYWGSVGTNGYWGSVGYTGSRGAEGYWGSVGTAGYWGSRGFLGYTGSIGAGYTGSASTVAGYSGSVGSIGYTGSIGAGYTGSKGDRGDSGGVSTYSFIIQYAGANIDSITKTSTTTGWTIGFTTSTITITHSLGKWPLLVSCVGTTSTAGTNILRLGPGAGVAGGFITTFDAAGNGITMTSMTNSGTGTVSSGTCTVHIQFN